MAQEVNIPLLRKAVEWAEAEAALPEIDSEWRQDTWISNPESIAWNVACEALEEFGTPDRESLRSLAATLEPHCGTAYCIAGYVAQAVDVRYRTTDIVDGVHSAAAAARSLGIAYDSTLFNATNTIEDIRRIAESLAGERL